MDVLRKELRRLFAGNNVEEMPPSLGLMSVAVDCPGNAQEVLTLARELLVVILSAHLVSSVNRPYVHIESDDDFEEVEAWCEHALTDIEPEESCSPSDYVPYLNEVRDWFWWDAKIIDVVQIQLRIEVHGFPVSGFDALRCLFLSCGATSVEQDE